MTSGSMQLTEYRCSPAPAPRDTVLNESEEIFILSISTQGQREEDKSYK